MAVCVAYPGYPLQREAFRGSLGRIRVVVGVRGASGVRLRYVRGVSAPFIGIAVLRRLDPARAPINRQRRRAPARMGGAAVRTTASGSVLPSASTAGRSPSRINPSRKSRARVLRRSWSILSARQLD